MNKANLRVKGSKRGVTPVIATIILIAGTLVLALVVGAYTFGLFGSNVKTITLTSGTLYGGSASGSGSGASSMSVSLNNPGGQTYISGITLTGSGLSAPVTTWWNSSGKAVNFGTSDGRQACPAPPVGYNNNIQCAGSVNSFTFYPVLASNSIITGQTFNYVINFQNGQSVSGSLIAQ